MRIIARVALCLFLLFAFSAAADVTATKSVSGTFVQGTNVTYTIVLTNGMAGAQGDNPGDEFRDPLPSGLTFVGADATSGTAVYLTTIGAVGWDGSIPAGESVTVTIEAMIGPAATGTISNQGMVHFDADGNGSNDSSGLTDDPSTGAAGDATSFNVVQTGSVTATKSASGTRVQGTEVTYTIVLTNDMTVEQGDNAGDEFRDELPAGLTFVSADATSGTATYLTTINAVGWNGTIPAGGSVTVTVVCTIDANAFGAISNQGQINYDRDSDNVNESSGVTDDPDTGEPDDATSFTVLQSGIVSATKSVSGTFVQGTEVTYTIVVTNNMSIAQNDHYSHEFTDGLPSGLTLVSTSATSGTVLSFGNVVLWDGTLAPGESVTITVVATIDANASGTISNQGQTIFDRDGDDVHNESSQVTDDPSTAAEYDATSFQVIQSGIVSATKSVSGTFVQGSEVTYTIVMTNNMSIAQNDHYGHEFTDILPAGLTLVSTSATSGTAASCCGNIVFWDGTLAPGESVTITVVATIDANASGTISNQGQTIFDRDGDDVHNESSQVTDDPSTAAEYDATSFSVIQSGAVTSTMSVSGSFVQGTEVTYTVVMTNEMSVDQPDNFGHEWTDILPDGVTLVSVSASSGTTGKVANIAFWDGARAVGESVTITIVATVDATASGTISNQGQSIFDRDGDGQNESEWKTDDPSTAAELDATSFNVIYSGAVTSTKSVSGTFVQGTDVTYTVVMTNEMTVAQPDNFGHEWTDILPDGLTLVSVSASSGTTGQVANIAFWDGARAVGESVTITIVATIDATASGTISNQGQSIFDRDGDGQNESEYKTDDPSTAAALDATSFNVIQSGIVTSTMSVSGTFVQGTDVTYTVVMTNNMTVAQPDSFGHEWTDNLPNGLTFVSASASSGTIAGCCGGEIVFWDGSIPAGGSVTLTFVATISATASGTISNQGQTIFDRDGDNQNESSQITDDPSTAAEYDATSFNVIQSGIVTSTMSVSGTFVQGTDVTYTVVMTNNMSVTQPDNFGHEWTDILPSGLTFVSASASSGTILGCCGGEIVFWDGSIPAGGSVTLTFVATISATASGAISNQGQTIFDRDGDNQNESSQITDDPSTAAAYDATSFNVVQSNVVTSTKAVSGTFVQGTNVTYTVVMTNNMTVTQPDNFGHEWTDNLPAGLTLVSVSASSGTTGKVANIAFWDGSLVSGGSVTITIVATIGSTASGTISNQGQSIFDRNGDGQNESEYKTDDPSTAASPDATSFNVVQSNIVTSTMSVSGTLVQGTNVTYTVVMTNNMTVTQPDNFGHEWTDILPGGLTLVSVSASSGTTGKVANIAFWDGSLASGGSVTITIVATIGSTASGTISNQGQTIFDRNGDGQNESSQVTDDPSTAASYDATSFNVVQSNIVTSTMSVSGAFLRSTNVTYTVVMTNNMTVIQPDNFGHEWTDNLPSGLTLVSVNASSGTTGMVSSIAYWDGSLASGGSVTITIVATIGSTASGTISNQGQSIFDRNGDGQNESSQVTDDPSTATAYDATSFTVAGADLSLTMTYLPSAPGQHEDVTYTLVVSNGGPQTATNVVVSDDRPDDATFVSASSTQGSCTTADPVVCSVGSLASGASATITLVVKTPSSYDSLTNTATATADQTDQTPASATASFNCMKLKKGVLKPCSAN